MRTTKPTSTARGFSLVELLVAIALGLIVLAATTQLFKNGMDATVLVSQSSEMQQNVRATLNLVSKDVSMAGSGLPSGGLALPYGAGATRFILCGRSDESMVGQQYLSHWNRRRRSGHQFHVRHYSRRGQRDGAWRTSHTDSHGSRVRRGHGGVQDYAFPLNQYIATLRQTQMGRG